MLSLYRKLLEVRRKHPALHAGEIRDVRSKRGVLVYTRALAAERFQVLLNLSHEVQTVNCDHGHIVMTTILDGEGARVGGPVVVEAGEGLLIALD
jgi:alpha-glucosidase